MCEIEWGDYEPFQCYTETQPRAAKVHRCTACQGDIAVGVRYMRIFAKFDGEVFVYRVCLDCQADRDVFRDVHHGNVTPDSFTEILNECIDTELEDDSDESRATAERWRAVLRRIRQRSQGRLEAHARYLFRHLEPA